MIIIVNQGHSELLQKASESFYYFLNYYNEEIFYLYNH